VLVAVLPVVTVADVGAEETVKSVPYLRKQPWAGWADHPESAPVCHCEDQIILLLLYHGSGGL
jgi:hypothetical protein